MNLIYSPHQFSGLNPRESGRENVESASEEKIFHKEKERDRGLQFKVLNELRAKEMSWGEEIVKALCQWFIVIVDPKDFMPACSIETCRPKQYSQ